jgi:hypothetical protein
LNQILGSVTGTGGWSTSCKERGAIVVVFVGQALSIANNAPAAHNRKMC